MKQMMTELPVDFEVQVTPKQLPTESDTYSFVCRGCALTKDYLTMRFISPQYARVHLGKHREVGHDVPPQTWLSVAIYGEE